MDMTYQEFRKTLLKDKSRCSHNRNCIHLFKDFTFRFRLSGFLYTKPSIYLPVRKIVTWIYKRKQIKYGIQLPIGTHIGGGLKFVHYSGIVFAKGARIGENCTIHQGVTIGRGFSISKDKYPTIGDGVVLFANAVVSGGG